MTLEEILAQIESDELKEAIVGKINEETEKGKSLYSKKDREVLKFKTALKELGYDHEKYADVSEFIDTKKEVESKVNDSKLTIATLNDKLNDLTSKLEQERAEADRAKRVSKENKITAELTNKIGGEFFGASYLIKTLISDGKVDIDENNQLFFREGEDVIPFEKGLDQLKQENKDMLRVTQQGGTGDVGGQGIGEKADLLDKPTDEILNELGL